MAQSGFTPIQLYRSATPGAVPLAADLAAGELALNTADEKLFFENASGSVVSIDAANGTVTSVALSGGTTGLTVSGSPITTSGTITLAGTLAVANGGTGVTTSTGTGSVALSTSPTFVTPTLGAASATSIANGLGAASTPSYTFTGDTNTGMLSPAADTVAVSTNGSERMRINSAGNVGIGTSAPETNLHINQSTGGASIEVSHFSGGTYPKATGISFGSNNGTFDVDNAGGTKTFRGSAGIYANSIEAPNTRTGLNLWTIDGSNKGVRIYIAQTGRVGINTTTAVNPDYQLQVNGTFGFKPGASVTPANNGDVVFELTNNTTLTIKAKGSDGVVRSGTITLA